MSRIQIFIPHDVAGGDVSASDAFKLVGLDHMTGMDPPQVLSDGPGGKPGRLFFWVDPLCMRHGYDPAKQTWIPAAKRNDLESQRYYVGVWDDSPPTEEQLRRTDCRSGKFIPLGKTQWLITTPATLDRVARLQVDGSIQWCVDSAFNWLVTGLEKLKAEAVIEQDDREIIMFDFDREFWFLCSLMQINYRLTPELCSYLELFTQDTIRPLIAGLMGRTLKA